MVGAELCSPVLARIQVEIQTVVLRNARHDHQPGRVMTPPSFPDWNTKSACPIINPFAVEAKFIEDIDNVRRFLVF